MSLQRYADYQPTGFDARGLRARTMGPEDDEDRSEWLVCPVGRTRDTEDAPDTASNWAAQLDALGGEGADVEVHRFGHWGPGWFEIVIVRPDTRAAVVAEEIAGRLENYPLLDDEDHSRREYEAQLEGLRDQARTLVREGAPEDWPARLFSKLWDSAEGQAGLQALIQPGGGHVDEDVLRAALRALKLIEPKWLYRTLYLRRVTVARTGWPAKYRDLRVRRKNPAHPDY